MHVGERCLDSGKLIAGLFVKVFSLRADSVSVNPKALIPNIRTNHFLQMKGKFDKLMYADCYQLICN